MTDVRVIIDSQDLFNKYLTFFTGQNVLLWTVSQPASPSCMAAAAAVYDVCVCI
jgi:hypothetical protein